MNTRLINILKQKEGIAIMSVVLFFTVITLMLSTLSFVSLNNTRMMDSTSQNIAAFYAAEAGLTVVAQQLRAIYEDSLLTEEVAETRLEAVRNYFLRYPEITIGDSGEGASSARVAFETFNLDLARNTLRARISSVGRVGSQTRTLSKEVEIGYGTASNFSTSYAVLVRNSIIARGTITSDPAPSPTQNRPMVATMQTSNSSIRINGVFPHGVTVFEKQMAFPTINLSIRRDEANRLFPPSASFTHTSLRMAMVGNSLSGGNYFIDHLDFNALSNSGVRGIDIPPGQNVFIVTNRLTVGPVSISGHGTLTIFVREGANNFRIMRGAFGRVDTNERLAIYIDTFRGVLDGLFHVEFPNNSTINGYLMFANARIRFRPNSRLNGGLFTGAFNGSAGAEAIRVLNNAHLGDGIGPALLVAPNGTIRFENNSSMRGAVIANDFYQSGPHNTTLTFSPNLPTTIPFNITSPSPLGSGAGSASGRRFSVFPTVER